MRHLCFQVGEVGVKSHKFHFLVSRDKKYFSKIMLLHQIPVPHYSYFYAEPFAVADYGMSVTDWQSWNFEL